MTTQVCTSISSLETDAALVFRISFNSELTDVFVSSFSQIHQEFYGEYW